MVMAVAVRMVVPMPMIVDVCFRGRLGGGPAVAMPVIMIVVFMVVFMVVIVIVIVVIVMLAHASFPLAGSAICSSISFRTSLICASAAE